MLKLLPKPATATNWDKVLQTPRSSNVLAELFLILNRQKRYNEAVEGIQSALRNDLAQPWMYDVLAVQMKLAGRPQKQIDRVLLSRVDFSQGNEAQLMVTAALLARYRAYEEAIALCKEVVKRNPWQSAAWDFAKLMADRTGNPEHVLWSRLGVIRHVWTDDAKIRHEAAAEELRQLAADLRTAGNTKLAARTEDALRESLKRDLTIQLRWAGDADLDLIVTAPDGSECSYRRRFSTHAVLSQTSDGATTSRQHLEEFVAPQAMSGDYKIKVRFVTGRVITGAALLQVIRHDNSPERDARSIRIKLAGDDATATVEVNNGRWQK